MQLAIINDTRRRAAERAVEASQHCDKVFSYETAEAASRVSRKLNTLCGLLFPSRAPWEFFNSDSPSIVEFVDQIAVQQDSEIILWIGGSEAASLYAKRNHARPCVIDWCDSPSLNLSRTMGNSPLESWRVKKAIKWEISVRSSVHASIYISDVDATFANDDGHGVHVIPNGILDDMPEDLTSNNQGLCVGFLGNMGYPPNVRGALRLFRIFKSLSKEIDGLRLKIIGRVPTKEILSLAETHVEVTGAVDSIWPHIRGCDVMVFPMESGAGLQNKILESMHAERPVVASSICLDPLGHGVHAVAMRADTDEEFHSAIETLLLSDSLRSSLGRKARTFVSQFDWQAILPKYEEVVLSAL